MPEDILEQEYPFSFRGKSYILREPSEAGNIKFQRAQFQDAKMQDGKVTANLERAVEAPSVLVGECVYEAGADKPVGAAGVVNWPKRLVKDLFERARRMSGDDEVESIDAQIKKLQEIKEGLKEVDPKK